MMILSMLEMIMIRCGPGRILIYSVGIIILGWVVLYSVCRPATGSDSASPTSEGMRLASASGAMKLRMDGRDGTGGRNKGGRSAHGVGTVIVAEGTGGSFHEQGRGMIAVGQTGSWLGGERMGRMLAMTECLL